MTRGRVIAVERSEDGPGRAALVVDGRLEDLLLDPPAGDPLPAPESIHWARVDRCVPQIGAAFVRLDGAMGWLRAHGLKPGAMVPVQVTRWADPDKAVPLTDRPLFKGRLAILTPGAPGANVARGIRGHEQRERLAALGAEGLVGAEESLGCILRSAAADADDAAVRDEIAALRRLAEDVLADASGQTPRCLLAAPDAAARAFRDWADPAPEAVLDDDDAFERLGLWDTIEALRSPEVALPGGGRMRVETTRAVVAVDVDTGGDFSKNAAATANLAACTELPRQLRLRGLGGLVLVDFAPVKKGARQGIDKALGRALSADPVETQIGGWTPLGNLEMVRKRERRPLSEVLHAHL